jgi:FKBP-type peptidyl-prolyl cis-trans isomerase 2
MAQAKNGDTVTVHYTGRFTDGTVFDTSVSGEPLEFTIGERHVIPGFEQAVLGMDVGDSKTVNIASEDAYGDHEEDLVFQLEPDSFPPDLKLEVGQQLQLDQPDGRVIHLRVAEITESMVTLDANHPLAGEDLTFELDLVGIVRQGQ